MIQIIERGPARITLAVPITTQRETDMSQYRKIMIVTNPAMKHGVAYRRGVELAKRTGAALVLALADYNPALVRAHLLDPDRLRKIIDGYLSVRRRWLAGEAEKLKEQGLQAEAFAIWHKPTWEATARQVLDHAPDLVIKDVDTNSALQRAIFTPADWHLMRVCPAPLMLVDSHSSSFPQRILAAVDPFDTHDKPADLNDRILEAALAMAYQCDATVHVVHAHDYLSAAFFLGDEADARYLAAARETHREKFIAFGKAHGIPRDRMHFVEGSPARVIADLAEDINADLVVLGTVVRPRLKRILIGATAEEILGVIHSDVMVLKPQGFATAAEKELNGA